ncbi:Trp biosynthesis-associated membrane protein [Planctomonas sp. JC2975]|uniref:Trp biosynthesis-associated membrane protein n=1 Tax=Planctomonas sp. JC2975 TaxID=2729626 RepID=UPI0014758F78|nr:Trp biosynthesis-associated membrane protein [Planctomonas sp. JC2975]
METSSRRTGSRIKYSVILVAVLASALVLTASTQTWYTLHLTAASGHSGTLTVSGADAAPAIAALSLAGVAFGGALALAGRVLRYVLAVLGIVLAASIIGSVASAMVDPAATGITVVTKATGIAGDAGVRAVIAGADATAWPAVALVAGIVLALAAIAAAVTAHRWPTASRRYGATQDASAPIHQDDSAANAEDDDQLSAADQRARARDAAIDDWDELSRGDDPTDTDDPAADDPAAGEAEVDASEADGEADGGTPPVR